MDGKHGQQTEFDNNTEKVPIFEENYNEIDFKNIVNLKTNPSIKKLQNFYQKHPEFNIKSGDPKVNIIDRTSKFPKSLFIPPESQQEFFTLLQECYDAKAEGLSLSERQVYPSGIMLDFDRYQKTNNRDIGQRHFMKICKFINAFFKIHLELENKDFSANIFFIERQEITTENAHPKYGNCYKYGFHVLVPEVWITKEFKQFMIDELAKILDSVFKDVDCSIQPGRDMLDRACSSVPVLFLGSSSPGKKPYILTHQAEVKIPLEALMYIESDTECYPADLRALSQYNLIYELALTFYFEEYTHQGVFRQSWLKKRAYSPKPATLDAIRGLMERRAAQRLLGAEEVEGVDNEVAELLSEDFEARHLKDIMDKCLSADYYTDYAKWRDMIFALAHTSSRYRPLAHWFSQKCPEKYSRDAVNRLWDEAVMKNGNSGNLTKRSIYYWAISCDKVKFNAIARGTITGIITQKVYDDDGAIEQAFLARLLYNEFGYKYVVVRRTGSKADEYVWYEFVTEANSRDKRGTIYKWRQETPPFSLQRFIFEKLQNIYKNIQDEIKNSCEKEADQIKARYYANVYKEFKNSKRAIQRSTFVDGVIKLARAYFVDHNFAEELDSYPGILGVGNGILFLGPEPRLLRGTHEYKVSKYTTVNYVPFDPAREQIKILLDAFRAIFIEDDVFEFMMMYLSTSLGGYETEPILMIVKGGGSNGKSFTTEMTAETLGDDYGYKAPLSFLTRPREDSERPNSAYAAFEGKRLIYFSEPNGIETLNTGRIKEVTGGEKQTNRDLNSKQRNFRMQSTLMTTTNYDYRVNTTDDGTWRRLRIYNTKIKFVLNPDPNNKYERKENPRLIKEHKNDPEFKQAMLSILVYYNQKLHNQYGGDIRNVPCPTIMRETEEFRNRQDTINRFICQMIVRKVSGPADEYSLEEIAIKYIDWYKRHINANIHESIQDICLQFHNSKISKFLERRNDIELYLIGHRLRGDEKEPIGPDEMMLSGPPKNLPKGPEKVKEMPEKEALILPGDDTPSGPKNEELPDNIMDGF